MRWPCSNEEGGRREGPREDAWSTGSQGQPLMHRHHSKPHGQALAETFGSFVS